MHGMGYALAHGADEAELDKMHQMMERMPFGLGTSANFWQLNWLLGLITWILIIAFLAAAVRWMWKKGGGR